MADTRQMYIDGQWVDAADGARFEDGAANVLTAQICKSTNQQPTAVCTAPGVVAAAAKLQ